MAAARKVAYLDHWTKQGQWHRTTREAQFGMDIFGKTLGIIGLGHIGAAVARRGFYGFNMNILTIIAMKTGIGSRAQCTVLFSEGAFAALRFRGGYRGFKC